MFVRLVTKASCALLILLTGCVMSKDPIRPPGPIDERLLGSWTQQDDDDDDLRFLVIHQVDGPWFGFTYWTYPIEKLSDLHRYRGFISVLGEQGFLNILIPESWNKNEDREVYYMLFAYRFDDKGQFEMCSLVGDGGVVYSAVAEGRLAGEMFHSDEHDTTIELSASSGEIMRLLSGATWENLCRGVNVAKYDPF